MGACERCDGGGNCLSAPCNFECKHYGDWCETIVMGGYGKAVLNNLSEQERSAFARFTAGFRIDACTDLMIAAGLKVGDWVTHVDNTLPQDMTDFGMLVCFLTPGTSLKIWRGMKRLDVTL